MATKVHILKANHGDCILVTHTTQTKTFNILIDGGTRNTFKHGPHNRFKGDLCTKLDELKADNQKIDLAILTHVDDDHIGGMLKAFNSEGYLKEMVDNIWFYSSKTITSHFEHPPISANTIYVNDSSLTSVGQGKEFDRLLDEIGCKRVQILMSGEKLEFGPLKFTVLSPNEKNLRDLLSEWPKDVSDPLTSEKANDHSQKFADLIKDDVFEEDTSIKNGSSIGFLLEIENKKMLFLGDSFDTTIREGLGNLGYSEANKLHVDLVKISHHGSQHNTSQDLLKLISSQKYIISTNGSRHGHPHKKTISRILNSDKNGLILFNYETVIESLTRVEDDQAVKGRLVKIDEGIEL